MSNITYVEAGADGRIHVVGYVQAEALYLIPPLWGGTIMTVPDDLGAIVKSTEHYIFEERFYPRPEIAVPEKTEMLGDGTDEIHFDFPHGTTIRFKAIRSNLDISTIETLTVAGDEGLTLTWDEPGRLRIDAEPPFPYKPFEMEVIVHAV